MLSAVNSTLSNSKLCSRILGKLGTCGSLYATLAPKSRNFSITNTDGLSRMSSTFFLYAIPSINTRLPLSDFSRSFKAKAVLLTT